MAGQWQDGGLGVVSAAVVGLSATAPKYLAWGTGTAAAKSATGLTTATAPTTVTAVTGTIAQATTSKTNDTVRVTGTITTSATPTITEVGAYTNATMASGTLTLYGNFTGLPLGVGDSIAFTVDGVETN